MKNLRFVSGLFLGLIFGVFLSLIITCKSGSSQQVPNSSTFVDVNNFPGSVYKLSIDNIQYIVVSSGTNGGIAIIKQ